MCNQRNQRLNTAAQFFCAEWKNQPKRTKLCETNPIFETPKMLVTPVPAITTNNEQPTTNRQKRTQTKPNLLHTDPAIINLKGCSKFVLDGQLQIGFIYEKLRTV
jgi:hypothetical protein